MRPNLLSSILLLLLSATALTPDREEQERLIEEEDEARAAFAENDPSVLSQEHLNLLDVFGTPSLFVFEDEDDDEVSRLRCVAERKEGKTETRG